MVATTKQRLGVRSNIPPERNSMKLDLLYEIQPKPKPWTLPHPYGQRDAEQRSYYEMVEQVKLADRLGFETVWFPEHHFRESRSASASNEVVLGALALVTEQIRLGFGVVLMPPGFQHPARVAEKVATVDILSRGRVEWGTGRSTPAEQVAFGVPVDDRSREQWREATEIVTRMWEAERLSWTSDLIDFPERIVGPKPFQDPHPPCWLAASSPRTAVTAGKLGLGLLSFALLQPIEVMADTIRCYREAQSDPSASLLTRVRNDRVGAYTLVHCCDDLDVAADYGLWDSVRWWYEDIARFTAEWEIPLMNAEQKAMVDSVSNLARALEGDVDVNAFNDQDMIIIGTPETCLEKIIHWDEIGVDQLLCYVQFGDLPHDAIMRNLELLATKVMPVLEARGHRVSLRAEV